MKVDGVAMALIARTLDSTRPCSLAGPSIGERNEESDRILYSSEKASFVDEIMFFIILFRYSFLVVDLRTTTLRALPKIV